MIEELTSLIDHHHRHHRFVTPMIHLTLSEERHSLKQPTHNAREGGDFIPLINLLSGLQFVAFVIVALTPAAGDWLMGY